MAGRKPTGARSETVRCENCGEYYATTYKRCPFCEERADRRSRRQDDDYEENYDLFDDDEYEDDDDYEPRRSGGKRLTTNRRGGGYGRAVSPLQIVGWVLSIALIIAAIWIVVSFIKPLVSRGDPSPMPSPPVASTSPSPSTKPSTSPSPKPSTSPSTEPSVEPSTDPTVSPEPSQQIPSTQTATGFTLNKKDISISDQWPAPYTLKVTFSPAGSTGTITWTSSKPDVISVDENGKCTALKAGTATITATMAGGFTQTCIVRSTISRPASSGGSTSTSSPAPSASASTTLSLNKTDFTWYSLNEAPVQMKVKGTESTPTWSIGNTSVATIDAGGLVKPAGPGTTTITCTVDGQTLKCIVRCNW